MGIYHLEIAKQLRVQGERLRRPGLSQRVFDLVDAFNKNRTYKNAMHLAGQLRAITQAAKYDSYWDEKVELGFQRECFELEHYEFEEIAENDSLT